MQVQSFRVRQPLALYQSLILEPYLAAAAEHHARVAAALLHDHDVSHYMKHVLEGTYLPSHSLTLPQPIHRERNPDQTRALQF
jgi:hypothetical protein